MREIIGVVLGAVATWALAVAIGAALVWLLWNAVCPDLFGLREATYWQAVGLCMLVHALFGPVAHHARGKRS